MPLSWGRRYCVYKYQGFPFLYCDSGFIQCARLSDRIFSISSTLLSILSVPIISNVLAGISIRIKSSFSTKAIGPPSEASGDTCPIAGPRVAPEKRTVGGSMRWSLPTAGIGGDRFCRIKHFWHSTSFRSFITDKYRFSRMDFLL